MLESIFPIFLYITLGYIAKIFRIFEERDSKAFIDFIVYFSFPAIVFKNIYFLEIDSSLYSLIAFGWAALFVSMLLSFAYSKVLRFDKKTTIVVILMASFGNTAFVGIPYNDIFFGSEGVAYAIIYDQFVSFLAVSIIAPLLISIAGGDFSIKSVTKKIFLFPPFLVLVIAIFCRDLPIPLFFFGGLDMLGATVVPLALFTVGFGLNFKEVRDSLGRVLPILSIKLLIVPLLLAWAIYLFGFYDELPYKVAIFQSAMPPMIYASVLAIRGGLDRAIALSAVGLGVILSVIVFPLLYEIVS